MNVELRPSRETELDEIIELEGASYPSDEAASPESLKYRLAEASSYFWSIWNDEKLIGFVCGTRCSEWTAEAMGGHEKSGEILGIHSVVIKPEFRRRGIAKFAVRWYCDEVLQHDGSIKKIMLLAKVGLLQLYIKAGFCVKGLSSIVHGAEQWFDLELEKGIQMLQVDAFSSNAFGGNPAAVVFRHGTVSWMQSVAKENNLSETAFLRRLGPNDFAIRWFTPTTEVALCGHATLASAYALWSTNRIATNSITFHTRTAGNLIVAKDTDNWLQMDLPTSQVTHITKVPLSLSEALGSHVDIIGCAHGPPGLPDWLIEIPSLDAIKEIDGNNFGLEIVQRGVIVTAKAPADSPYAFESRFFAPNVGILEDPVTGSSFSLLAPYWKVDGESVLARQASERGGVIRVHATSSGTEESESRTIVQGQATLVLEARLFVPRHDIEL